MKYVILVLVCFSCSATAFAQTDTKATAESIKRFYCYYMIESDNPPPHKEVSKDTLRKYFSVSFLKKMRTDRELDYDPIVHAQDYDKEFVKTLKVSKCGDGSDGKFCISYWYEADKKYDSLYVYVIREAGAWKINKTCHEGDCYPAGK